MTESSRDAAQREVTWTWNLQPEGDTIRCTICEGDRPALIITGRDVRWMAQALAIEARRSTETPPLGERAEMNDFRAGYEFGYGDGQVGEYQPGKYLAAAEPPTGDAEGRVVKCPRCHRRAVAAVLRDGTQTWRCVACGWCFAPVNFGHYPGCPRGQA